MIRVALPWPDSRLSPNARGHWRIAYEAKRAAREQALWAAVEAMGRGPRPTAPLNVKLTFQPPDKRRRDTDNMLASAKAALDGVSDAIGVDDAHWTLTIHRAEPVKGGAVVVEIT